MMLSSHDVFISSRLDSERNDCSLGFSLELEGHLIYVSYLSPNTGNCQDREMVINKREA